MSLLLNSDRIASKLVTARKGFVHALCARSGIAPNDAEKVFSVFKKKQMVRFDEIHGRYVVTHRNYFRNYYVKRSIRMYDQHKHGLA